MRVILAEDSTPLREGVARLLTEERHEVVAAVGDATELIRATVAYVVSTVAALVALAVVAVLLRPSPSVPEPEPDLVEA